MNIYIPSRARYAARFLLGRYTPLSWITDQLAPRCFYVVRSDEFDEYKVALRGAGVGVLDCGLTQTVADKRQWIAEHAQGNKEPTFLMCDDDVALYVRKSPSVWTLRYPTSHEINGLFDQFDVLLEKYAQVAISAREGNNRAGVGPFPLILENTRALRMYAYRTQDYLRIEPNRLTEMMDFDTTLQLLKQGHKNAVVHYWANGQPMSQYDGGCSIYRDLITHDAAARQLAAYHPGLVRLRQQKSKSHQNGFGDRTEVTVSWSAAYDRRETQDG